MDQEAKAERQRLEALEKAQENLKRRNNWTYRR
jgi:hypothetical protein